MLFKLFAMLVCVVLSGYFSATETAFSALNRTRLRTLAEGGSHRAALTLRLEKDYDRLISTILIGNNIVNIAVASLGALVFGELLGQELGAAVSTAVVTVVVLIFGEITPKSLAKDHPETFAMFSAPILKGIVWFFTPLNYIFTQWKKLVGRLFTSGGDSKMSQEEFLVLLQEVEQEGAIDAGEGVLLRNAVEFGDLEARDILTHRVDLAAVPVEAERSTVAEEFDESGLSRLLVYEEDIDHIVGVLHLKDFYGRGGESKPIAQLMAAPVFVTQNEKIDDLLQLLRSTKSHLAIVVDEFGGTLGIVTMEDILEELVGEIWDEHDRVEEPIRTVGEQEFLVAGSASMSDFRDWFGVPDEFESTSVGGWVMEQLGGIPSVGDCFRYEPIEVTVEQVEDRRVIEVRVRVSQ